MRFAPQTLASASATAINVCRVDSHSLRIPVVFADPIAAWVAEGGEISAADPTLTEVTVTPPKLAGPVVISAELAADSSPAALQVVGDGLVRDLARKADAAFFANTTTNGPAGLLSIASTAVDAGDAWADLDWAEAAKSNAEQHNTMVTSFVCNPATALAVSTIKETTTSTRTLLGADPTAPASRTVAGVPLLTSSTIADGILWGIPKSRVVVALRSGTEVTTDSSAFFTSHRVAVRAVLRVGWAFTDPAAVSKIAITP